MIRRPAAALGLSLVAALAACTAMNEFSATQNEKLLRPAGFKVVAADTPARIEALKSLAPGKISRVGRGGTIYFVFSDPYECRCFWVGQEPQYLMYRRLEADEMVPAVELVGVDAEPDWSQNMEPW